MKRKFLLIGIPIALLVIASVAAQSNFNTSLHFTREGKRTAYRAENGGFESITGVPIENLGCLRCHSTTGFNAAGQAIDPATYVPGCNDCHDAQWNVAEGTCLNCHSRQRLERMRFPGLDVHTAAGLTCMDCHSRQELHGDDGVAYSSLKEPGAIKVQCEDCHGQLPDTPSHVIHAETVDCAACHSVSVVNCVSCHFESLIEGFNTRPNAQIQNYRLLLKNQGKADVGSLMTHTYQGQTNVIMSSFHSHVITRDASDCSTCHFNFGEQNQAIAEYNSTGQITVNRWNETTRRIDGPEGVVPIPMDWRTALRFDYAVYTGDPASPTTDPQAWEFLKSESDNAHLFFAEPLDPDAMRALGMVVRPQEGMLVDTFYFPLFGDGNFGNIRFTTGLLLANVGEDAMLEMEFFDRAGAPLEVTLDGQGPQSVFELPAARGRSYSVETSGEPTPGQVGYVVVKVRTPAAQGAGVSEGTGQVGGTAVFARSDDGVLVSEAGVPGARPLTDFTLFLDSLGRRDTGLAVVNPPVENPPGSMATMTLTVWDMEFTSPIAQTQVSLEPGAALSQFIWEIFRDGGADPSVVTALQEMEAAVTVGSDVPVAALTIRQNDDPAVSFPAEVPSLTVFPVIPGRADLTTATGLK